MKPVTLFDRVYKASFRNQEFGWTSNAALRDALTRARRFVLSDEMSTFLGELGTQVFSGKKSREHRCRVMDNIRVGARLPHDTVWVEYNLRKCQTRSNEILGRYYDPTQSPMTEGWLVMRHAHLPNAFLLHIITALPLGIEDEWGFDTWTFPCGYAWVADDETVVPWKPITSDEPASFSHAELATGVIEYTSSRVAICRSPMVIPQLPKGDTKYVDNLLAEWTGVARRCMAFFATINDLPVEMSSVRPAKGFVAKGRYRKYLTYNTINLNVPAKRFTTIARKALADMHRKAHPVRGHWRDDWRHPYSKLCEHEFTADENHRWCVNCKGRESWVHDHIRGHASEGFNLPEYRVHHPEEERQ